VFTWTFQRLIKHSGFVLLRTLAGLHLQEILPLTVFPVNLMLKFSLEKGYETCCWESGFIPVVLEASGRYY
jgi:hypothetical protein